MLKCAERQAETAAAAAKAEASIRTDSALDFFLFLTPPAAKSLLTSTTIAAAAVAVLALQCAAVFFLPIFLLLCPGKLERIGFRLHQAILFAARRLTVVNEHSGNTVELLCLCFSLSRSAIFVLLLIQLLQ